MFANFTLVDLEPNSRPIICTTCYAAVRERRARGFSTRICVYGAWSVYVKYTQRHIYIFCLFCCFAAVLNGLMVLANQRHARARTDDARYGFGRTLLSVTLAVRPCQTMICLWCYFDRASSHNATWMYFIAFELFIHVKKQKMLGNYILICTFM